MARRSVLAARHGWMRSTGLARCRTRCPHAALRSHCDRPSIAHRPWAARARTFTTVGGGAGTPPSAELQQKHRDLRSRALHEAATEALAGHWAGMRHALVPRRARTQWTDAASERSNAASGSSGSPVDVAGSKSVATSGKRNAFVNGPTRLCLDCARRYSRQNCQHAVDARLCASGWLQLQWS